jgi:hypothetical protein
MVVYRQLAHGPEFQPRFEQEARVAGDLLKK